MRSQWVRWLLIGLALTVGAAACSDDDDNGGSIEAFCSVVEEIEAADLPTSDMLERAVAAAPSEIKDDMRTLADALAQFDEDDESTFEAVLSEEFTEAGDNTEQFADEHCGDDDDTGDDDTGDDDTGDDDSGDDTPADDSGTGTGTGTETDDTEAPADDEG